MIDLLLKPLTSREWVLLGLLQGVAGGAVLMVIAAVWSLLEGRPMEALSAPLLLPFAVLGAALNAVLGIPVYRWLVRQAASAAATAPKQDSGDAL